MINIGKHIKKPSSMKHLWTTLADRRRAGPPAFRRKYRHKLYATLSPTLGGRGPLTPLIFGPTGRVLLALSMSLAYD